MDEEWSPTSDAEHSHLEWQNLNVNPHSREHGHTANQKHPINACRVQSACAYRSCFVFCQHRKNCAVVCSRIKMHFFPLPDISLVTGKSVTSVIMLPARPHIASQDKSTHGKPVRWTPLLPCNSSLELGRFNNFAAEASTPADCMIHLAFGLSIIKDSPCTTTRCSYSQTCY